VKIIVRTSFRKLVLDRKKSVLVLFYKGWDFSPFWDDLAKSVASVQSLVIAKYDVEHNDVADLNVLSYPTIIYYPSHDKKGIRFELES